MKNNQQETIKLIEKDIEIAQQNIQIWESNLERYRNYVKELIDQLLTIKLEIKNETK